MDGVTLDDMDWGSGSVAEGTAEAENAKIALISHQRNFVRVLQGEASLGRPGSGAAAR